MQTTVTDLGSPGAENYFANSREQYFPHKQQQRQASLVALASFLLCGALLQSFEDKGQASTNSETVKRRQYFLSSKTGSSRNIFDQYLHGILFSAPSLTKTFRGKACVVYLFVYFKATQ